jgi:hypothetical protein
VLWEPTRRRFGEGRRRKLKGERTDPACGPTGVKATACLHTEIARNAGDPRRRREQPDAREGQAGPPGESERFIVPARPVKAGGGKGPQFQVNGRRSDRQESGFGPNTSDKRWRNSRDVACLSEEGPRPLVGDRMIPGPRAGCGKSARPVR